jgi:hypothetical protein
MRAWPGVLFLCLLCRHVCLPSLSFRVEWANLIFFQLALLLVTFLFPCNPRLGVTFPLSRIDLSCRCACCLQHDLNPIRLICSVHLQGAVAAFFAVSFLPFLSRRSQRPVKNKLFATVSDSSINSWDSWFIFNLRKNKHLLLHE